MGRTLTAALLVAFLANVEVLRADLLFESAILGQTGLDPSGPPININTTNLKGVRLSLDQPSVLTGIGGHFICCQSGNGSMFLALAPLESPNALPNSLSLDDALFSVLIHDPFPPGGENLSREYTVPLPDLEVPAGHYAIIVGGGLFGATGEGWLPVADNDLPGASYFSGSPFSWQDGGFFNQRFFLLGNPETEGNAPSIVPLPSAVLFGFMGLGIVSKVRRWIV